AVLCDQTDNVALGDDACDFAVVADDDDGADLAARQPQGNFLHAIVRTCSHHTARLRLEYLANNHWSSLRFWKVKPKECRTTTAPYFAWRCPVFSRLPVAFSHLSISALTAN